MLNNPVKLVPELKIYIFLFSYKRVHQERRIHVHNLAGDHAKKTKNACDRLKQQEQHTFNLTRVKNLHHRRI